MSEMVIPGTYISVRAEGLITAGRISSGIVGVVGTAESGPLDMPVTLANFADARAIFGRADDPSNALDPGSPMLTLVKSLQLAYDNGAASIIAVRVADAGAATAAFALPGDAAGTTVATLTAKTPGTYGNNLRVQVDAAAERAHIVNEISQSNTSLNYGGVVSVQGGKVSVRRAATHKVDTFDVLLPTVPPAPARTPAVGQVVLNPDTGALTFEATQTPAVGDQLLATYDIAPAKARLVTLSLGTTAERYTVPDGKTLVYYINAGSLLVTATGDAKNSGGLPKAGTDSYLGTGTNAQGANGASASGDDYATGLDTLSDRMVNLVVLAGQDAKTMGSQLISHLNTTENSDFERIGVIGAAGKTVDDYLGHDVSNGRVVLVAPGILNTDGSTLPPAYTAAAVAGLIASLDVQVSLTNKAVNVPDLGIRANRGQQAQLIGRSVLTVIAKDGYRVLKSITAAGEGDPFINITTRRIVDYAKYGVRSASNPYLGRLNNSRVRGALKSTIDAFLTGMVEDEALTGYSLTVDATRAQEIAGEVSVVMTLQPTFSIDYIRVVMNLQ